jgi:hypothetical protein
MRRQLRVAIRSRGEHQHAERGDRGDRGEALLVAELAFVRQLVVDIAKDALERLTEWRNWHAGAEPEFHSFPNEPSGDAMHSSATDETVH